MSSLRIFVVDISGLFRTQWEANQGKEESRAFHGAVAAVARERQGFDRVAVCCDSGRSSRQLVWPEYKANRNDPGEAYRVQLQRVIEQLEADGCLVFRAPELNPGSGYFAEADDVIGSVCRWARDGGHVVRIFSADKDLLQCVSDTCDRMTFQGVVMGPADVEAKCGIRPEQVPQWLALAGDGSDNFKPFPGIGDKRAVAILKEFGSALAAFDPENLDKLQVVTNESIARILRADGARDRAARCLDVATVLTTLDLGFNRLLAEPVYRKAPDEPTPDFAPPEPASAPNPPAAMPQAAEPLLAKVWRLAVGVLRSPARRPVPTRAIRMDQYGLEPQDPKQAWELASLLHSSQLYRQKFATPQAIMAVILRGRSLGIPAVQSLESATMVNGQVGWTARTLRALAMKSPDCEYFRIAETQPNRAVALCKRKGQPEVQVLSTTDEAQARGLVEPGGFWDKNPRAMNVAEVERCGARLVWPECVSGLLTADELQTPHSERA